MNFPFSQLRYPPSFYVRLVPPRSALSFLSRLSSSLSPYYLFSSSISTSHPLASRLAKATEGRASSRSLRRLVFSLSLIPFVSLHPFTLEGAFTLSRLSIYPSLSSPSGPLSSLSPFLSLPFSLLLLSLLRIYRGEQRMWMGWVSPRLGERSITCEPKGEEIRGARRIYRNGAERKPEWWNTAKHARSVSHPLRPSRRSALSSLAAFLLFRSFTLAPLPLPLRLASFSHCSSLPPHVPAPYVRNEPRVIHHNRFTCTSAVRTFTALVSAARCPDDSNGAVFIAK